jgi:hypothetical protein
LEVRIESYRDAGWNSSLFAIGGHTDRLRNVVPAPSAFQDWPTLKRQDFDHGDSTTRLVRARIVVAERRQMFHV